MNRFAEPMKRCRPNSIRSPTIKMPLRARRELNMVKPNEILFRIETTEEAARKSDAAASMPDVDAPDIAAGAKPTFTPKKSDLYSAPKNQRAPKARDRRQ
jgi:cell division protein FtsB